MFRRIALVLLAFVVVIGCAGPAKLTQKSQENLARGDRWRAWQLALKALDKEAGNSSALGAATAAGTSIAQDWERRILALADVDSLKAAEQVLEFAQFRATAAHYLTLPVSLSWPAREQRLRQTAAHTHYVRGKQALDNRRPKRANGEFLEAQRFVTGYRDAAKLADRALEKALTRVAIVPFRATRDDAALGVQVAERWRDDLARELTPPAARFTRVLGGDAVEGSMTLAQLAGISRGEAVRIGKRAGAQRVVWGNIGDVKSTARIEVFRDVVARRITEKDAQGHKSTRWVDVPIEVIARVRDVTVGIDYEVTAVKEGASLAHGRFDRSMSARVVWTSYDPEGDVSSYSLVSEASRTTNPSHAKEVESHWKTVCGAGTTLAQVLEARRGAKSGGRYSRDALPRFIAGAAFVFLEDLPPPEDLAFAALARSSSSLRDELLRLDAIDDVDLGVPVSETREK
jgi:hypothetical protein